jgi:hypothetical protein
MATLPSVITLWREVRAGDALARFEEDEMIGIVRFTADDCVLALPTNAESLLLIATACKAWGNPGCLSGALGSADRAQRVSLPCVFGSKKKGGENVQQAEKRQQ